MNVDKIRMTLLHKREQKGLSAESLGKMVGVNKTTIYRYEKGQIEKMPFTVVNRLAEVLEINPAFIAGFSDEPDIDTPTTLTQITDTSAKLEEPRQKIVLSTAEKQLEEQLREQETVNNKVVPLVGKSAANPAVLEYGDTDIKQQSFAHVPDNADCAIYIQGDSMEPLIKNGSIVFYKKQCDVENGEIVIVEIDGDGVTCKKLIKDYENERIILRSINKKYDDRVLKCEEIRIIGKVVM